MFRVADDNNGLEMRAPHTAIDMKKMIEKGHTTAANYEHYSTPMGSISHKDAHDFLNDYYSGPRQPQTLLEHNLAYEANSMPDDHLPASAQNDPLVLEKIYHTSMPSLTLVSPYVAKQPPASS